MSLAEAQDRAERLFRQRQEGTKALQEYRAKQEATRNLTAKLRAERLAREAINGKPKSERKKATRAWGHCLKEARRAVQVRAIKGVAENQKSDGTL
jgi:hypothetical protein